MTEPSLALGTAQWGLEYGIANRSGRPGRGEVERILHVARRSGIDTLDTARAYGDSEQVIGHLVGDDTSWRVVTKLAPDVCEPGVTGEQARRRAQESLEASRASLRRDRLDAVLLHRPDQRRGCDGAVWAHVLREREAGTIGALGVSTLRPDDAWEALEDPDMAVMQVPSSLLDRRLWTSGFFEAAREAGREVHVRSIFLQGVAFLTVGELPAHLSPLGEALDMVDDWARARDLGRPEAFLAFALALPIDCLLIGCERAEQLESNLVMLQGARSQVEAVLELAAHLPELPASCLDPFCWP